MHNVGTQSKTIRTLTQKKIIIIISSYKNFITVTVELDDRGVGWADEATVSDANEVPRLNQSVIFCTKNISKISSRSQKNRTLQSNHASTPQ